MRLEQEVRGRTHEVHFL